MDRWGRKECCEKSRISLHTLTLSRVSERKIDFLFRKFFPWERQEKTSRISTHAKGVEIKPTKLRRRKLNTTNFQEFTMPYFAVCT